MSFDRILLELVGGRGPKPDPTRRLLAFEREAEARRKEARAKKAQKLRKQRERWHVSKVNTAEYNHDRVRKRISRLERYPSQLGLETLVRFAQDPKTPEEQRVRACAIILAWGHGVLSKKWRD